MKQQLLVVLMILGIGLSLSAKPKRRIADPYSWRMTQPLGTPYRVPMDTLMLNFYSKDIPSSYSTAYGTTGNLGNAAINNIFFQRPDDIEFFFKTPLSHWIKTASNWTFYNTRLPLTQVSYLSGGSKANAQDHLSGTFSGNVNKRVEIGGNIDYILSRGHYTHQAAKDLSYSLFGSYMGDRYDLQMFLNTYNFVSQENGGIKDDNYILDPEEVQGGQGSVNTTSIPVNLNDAYNRIRGKEYYATHRYKLGFYREVEKDTTIVEEFVPVTSFIHTIEYNEGSHRFVNLSAAEDAEFFKHTYLDSDGTNDKTRYWSLRNTVGVSLLEGFNKYAKMGLAAYVTHEVRQFKQVNDTLLPGFTPEGCDPRPDYIHNRFKTTENLLWVGGELSKQQGELLTYYVNAHFGLLGSALGDVEVGGNVGTRFRLWKDTVRVRAYGYFKNVEPAFFLKEYTSNHFIWRNHFGKIRKIRLGGELAIERWRTYLNIGVENLQNYVYFNNDGVPAQEDKFIQVFSATLKQDLKFGIFNFDNEITYQKSSKPSVIPLPELSLTSRMYLLFPIAKVLQVQFGVDCHYYTSYKSLAYQPATMIFHTQNETKVGNYPFMDAYINCKLKMVRFFVLYSHANKGLFGGNNYFALPHYPMNPNMFQFGVSIDFSN